jgi:hypothetical protein
LTILSFTWVVRDCQKYKFWACATTLRIALTDSLPSISSMFYAHIFLYKILAPKITKLKHN